MNKQQLTQKLKAAAIVAFSRPDGTLNKYQLLKASGLTKQQLDVIFDETKNPTINSILAIADAVGLEIELKPKS